VLPIRKVRDARLSAGGASVAIATGDRVARIWSPEGTLGLEFPTRDRVEAVAFSPDGRTLATAGPKGVTLSNLRENGRFERLIEAGPETVDIAFSPDGRRLVTAGADGVGRIWSAVDGRRLQRLVGHRGPLTSARFSPDGKLVVTASADNYAIVWNAASGERYQRLRGHGAIVSDAGFSSDGRWVVTAGPGRAGLWEVRTGKLLSFLDGHFHPIRAAAFGEHGFSVFTAGDDGTVRTYTCEVCAPLSALLTLADRRLALADGGPR